MRDGTMNNRWKTEMGRARRAILLGLALGLLPWASRAGAQQSTSYRVESGVANSGGRPEQGIVLAGAVYRISFDAIGDSTRAPGAASASFRVDSGTVSLYPPPGEVQNIRFSGQTAMIWDPDTSVGTYNLYRDVAATLPGGFGTCLQSGLAAASSADGSNPGLGQAYFYLPTAKNRIGEEGTKGYDSNNNQRSNPAPCP